MANLTFTRAVRVLALGAVFALASAAPPAAAATSSTTFSPSQLIIDTCQPGAECTGSATASEDGTQVVASSVSRPDVTEANEWSEARATGSVATRAPKGTGTLRVTFTWRVDSAITAANSTTVGGSAVGRIFADGEVSDCGSCVVKDDTNGKDVMVASTYSSFGPVPPEKVAVPGSLVSHTITIDDRKDKPLRAGTKLTLSGHTRAFSYVGGVCSGTCATEAHSGSASAEGELKLVSISMARGNAPDEPVLLDI